MHYYVLYDEECELCRRCRTWLTQQPKFVPLYFVPARDPATKHRFADLTLPDVPEELIVIDDKGRVFDGARAWIVCLWALRAYRALSMRLATPAMMPFAARAVKLMARNRLRLSRLLRRRTDEGLVQMLHHHDDRLGEPCTNGACTPPTWARSE